MGGCFGDFSSDLSESWQAKLDRKLTDVERATFRCQIEEARAQADENRNEKYAKAAERAKINLGCVEPRERRPSLFSEYYGLFVSSILRLIAR